MPDDVIFDHKEAQRSNNDNASVNDNGTSHILSRRLRGAIRRATEQPLKKEEEKLKELVTNSEKVLLKIKGVFPFDFFPDIVVIDVNKVNIIKRNFFLNRRLHSISIKSITEIYVQMSPIFASLHIVDIALNPGNKISVRYLHKKDAAKARRLIQGLIDANKQEIDLSNLTADEIVNSLNDAGRIRTRG